MLELLIFIKVARFGLFFLVRVLLFSLIPYFISLAKKAEAFFNISFSIRKVLFFLNGESMRKKLNALDPTRTPRVKLRLTMS